MNEIQQTQTPARFRDINTITAEIRTIKEQAARMLLCSYVELGRRLTEAKELLPHGEWGSWLRDEVEFSQSTANNLMNIYEEYGSEQESLFGETNSQALGNLTYTKAVSLLKVPKEEREEFVIEHHAAELSTRELDRLIKERDEALKAQAEAERERSETAEELEELNHNYAALTVVTKELRDTADTAEKAAEKERQEKMARERELKAAQGKLQSLEKENKELRERPVEVAVQIDEEAVKDAAAKARAEAEKEWGNKYKDLQKALNAAESRTDEAGEKEKDELRAQLEEMRKQLQLSNPQVSTFKAHLETFQQAFLNLLKDLDEAEKAEPKTAVGLMNALRAQLGKNLEALGR